MQTKGTCHTTQQSFLEGHLGGYTFVACIIGAVRIRCGVGEVDVLGTSVVEVVVLSAIGDQWDGSGSRGTRRLVKNHGGGSCTPVVVKLDGTNVLEGSRGK